MHASVRVSLIFVAIFNILNGEKLEKFFQTKYEILFRRSDISRNKIIIQLEEMRPQKSGWSLHEILSLQIVIAKYNPLSVGHNVEIPTWIKKKRGAILNIKTNDNSCFKTCITAALNTVPKENETDPNTYEEDRTLNFTGIGDGSGNHAFTCEDIKNFEILNLIAINVFVIGNEKKKLIAPVYNSKLEHSIYNVNFCLIKNLSALLAFQVNKHKSSLYFCEICLHYFYDEEKLSSHKINCKKINECAIILPTGENKIMKFRNFHKKLKNAFVIYADLEALLQPVKDLPEMVNAYQAHKAFAIGFYLKAIYDGCPLEGYYWYKGVNWFANGL